MRGLVHSTLAIEHFSLGKTIYSVISKDSSSRDVKESNKFSAIEDRGSTKASEVSFDVILPDDLLEQILAYLPVASICRAGSVCKKWNEIVNSRSFLRILLHSPSQKPWYFMFTTYNDPLGCAYDPALRKWYKIDLPCVETSDCLIASSSGLVSIMNRECCSGKLYVCNPITRNCRSIELQWRAEFSGYSALAISVSKITQSYKISILKSEQIPGDLFQWDLSIHLYDSKTMTWVTSLTEVLTGWRGGDECAICDGVLYFLIYATTCAEPEHRHGLLIYDPSQRSSGRLLASFVPVPCPLTCGRLMNMKEKLVLVGGIRRRVRADAIKDIGIWVLNGQEWQEISRLPQKFSRLLGEFDDVFVSSGLDELIYIQSYESPALVVFDMNRKLWKWSKKCPATKANYLQLFTGFCFEPRLEIAP